MTNDKIQELLEQLHDEIVHKIAQKPRDISSLTTNPLELPLNSIEDIVEHLSCRICMGIVDNPHVIKHCLHFFCKECIFTSLRQL